MGWGYKKQHPRGKYSKKFADCTARSYNYLPRSSLKKQVCTRYIYTCMAKIISHFGKNGLGQLFSMNLSFNFPDNLRNTHLRLTTSKRRKKTLSVRKFIKRFIHGTAGRNLELYFFGYQKHRF